MNHSVVTVPVSSLTFNQACYAHDQNGNVVELRYSSFNTQLQEYLFWVIHPDIDTLMVGLPINTSVYILK